MVDQPTNLEDGSSIWRQGENPSSGRTTFSRITHFITEEITFFRVHLAAFTFIPLIFSGIFYASNGRFRVSFLDSMFLCYSAMTVTGLSTVNLSTITAVAASNFVHPNDHRELSILGIFRDLRSTTSQGDFAISSWIMVLIRK